MEIQTFLFLIQTASRHLHARTAIPLFTPLSFCSGNESIRQLASVCEPSSSGFSSDAALFMCDALRPSRRAAVLTRTTRFYGAFGCAFSLERFRAFRRPPTVRCPPLTNACPTAASEINLPNCKPTKFFAASSCAIGSLRPDCETLTTHSDHLM